MLDDVSSSFGIKFFLAALVVGLALAGFFAAAYYIRRRSPGGLLGQGRQRRHRLQLLDTVVIDARRRVVLIRRDDVEHLLLIGGPADLVIEGGIEAAYDPQEPIPENTFENYSEPAQGQRDYDEEESFETAAMSDIPARQFSGPSVTPYVRTGEDNTPQHYKEWEDEDDVGDRYPDEGMQIDTYERQSGEPPTGTIRPVTLSRTERILLPPEKTEPAISEEEAALARELEAARRRTQIPGPRAPMLPSAPTPPSDFDRVLEQEMEEKLEAAKRQAQAKAPRPVVQQQRRNPSSTRSTGSQPEQTLQSGLSRIFGEGDKTEKE